MSGDGDPLVYGPTFDEMIRPEQLPEDLREAARIARSEAPEDAINLFNIHWKDDLGEVMGLLVPSELTGVSTPIAVLLGQKFPSGSYQVGAAYSILVEKQLHEEIAPQQRLVVPTVGNFGHATAWLGQRMGYPVEAIVPEEVSVGRFELLKQYGAQITQIPGGASNVPGLLEAARPYLDREDAVVINPYAEFGAYRFHAVVTAAAAIDLAEALKRISVGRGKISAFVAGTGTGGLLGAADTLKERFGTQAVAVEPSECGALYEAGFGAHKIDEAGPRMVTWIHNVWNLDAVALVPQMDAIRGMALLHDGSDVLTQELGVLESTAARMMGTFSPCGVLNLLGAIKAVRHFDLGPDDLVITVNPDASDRYVHLRRWLENEEGPQNRDLAVKRTEIFLRPPHGHVLDGTPRRRRRWHNQKFPTWVEQWGKSQEALDMQKNPEFWDELRSHTGIFDEALRRRRHPDW